MRFGVCGDVERARAAKAAGYDYWEPSVPWLLRPRESEAAFRNVLEEARRVEIPAEACNCFVPGDLKITGTDVDFSALKAYVEVAMLRAPQAGVRVIVFGSGGARTYPDGFDAKKAWILSTRFSSRSFWKSFILSK